MTIDASSASSSSSSSSSYVPLFQRAAAHKISSCSMAWSTLPSDILGNIATRIEHVTHFQSFSLVCRSWYECSVENRGHLPRRPPLAMLPYDEDTKTCNLLSFNRGLVQLHLPELSGKWCCGASKGWLVLIDNGYNVSLLNPSTRAELQLPQHPSFQEMIPEYSWHGAWKTKFIAKAVLSASPESPDCVVMLIVASFQMLSFCKLADGKWKTIRAYTNGGEITLFGDKQSAEVWIPQREYAQFRDAVRAQLVAERRWSRGRVYTDFQDVIWYGGKIYAAHEDTHATICDVDDLSLQEIRWPEDEHSVDRYDTFRYLVESRGELLLVIRYVLRRPRKEARGLPNVRKDRPYSEMYRTQSFSVYRMEKEMENDDGGARWWRKLESIGDRCLFVAGISESTCCSVLDFPRLRANCIYFADNFWDACFRNMYGCHDVGVFSLQSDTVEPLFNAPQPFFAHPLYFL